MRAGTFKIKENWKFQVVDHFTKEVISESEKCNLIVNTGLTAIRNFLAGDTVDNPIAIGIGTDNTTVTSTDTTLGTEYTRSTAIVTKSGSYAVEYTKTFSFASGVSTTIYEAGLFDNATVSGSTMIARVTDAGKAVSSTVDLIVTCTITVSTV